MIEYYKKCCIIIFQPNNIPESVTFEHSQKNKFIQPLSIDELIVNHTIKITSDFPVAKHLYYHKEILQNDIWDSNHYKKFLHKGADWGLEMQNAFQTAFHEGFRKVILIATNSLDLEKRHLEEALLSLKIIEFCIGPATNGGYYLIGMNEFEPILFQNKDWNSTNLCKSTIRDIGNLKAALYKLPVLGII